MITAKNNKIVIIVTGPTASGKTSAAISLAKQYDTEIISADSRQCYKELNIGVARPSVYELSEVPHHFIASHSIHDEVNAASFEKYALKKATALFQKHDVVIMVGGTGLYIRAFCEGLDAIPEIDTIVRTNIIRQYEEYGVEWLKEQIKQKDPLFYASSQMHNPQRLMRALEVVTGTGQSITSFQKQHHAIRDFSIVKIGIAMEREQLYDNINKRVDLMMQSGLLDEVKALLPYRKDNALQTVGYKELFSYLGGEWSIEVATDKIKTHSRQYAKRQLTWFRKDENIHWLPLAEVNNVPGLLSEWIMP